MRELWGRAGGCPRLMDFQAGVIKVKASGGRAVGDPRIACVAVCVEEASAFAGRECAQLGLFGIVWWARPSTSATRCPRPAPDGSRVSERSFDLWNS